MATKILRYNLEEFENIIFQGFDYKLPDEVIEKISDLAMQVGSPDYVKTPVFKKRDNPMKVEPTYTSNKEHHKKKRGNKGMEVVNDDDWNNMRSFQTTKIGSVKTGIEAEVDSIRTLVNKMSDKTYSDMRNKIIEIIQKITVEYSEVDLDTIGFAIFEMISTNRHFSKNFSELYSVLFKNFEFIKRQYKTNIDKFVESFNNIEFIEPNENYDKYCEINKVNEKRKSLSAFYGNLVELGVVSNEEFILITRNLLAKIYEYISIDNKKNEVEELTENFVILYNKELCEDSEYELIDDNTIEEIIEMIAKSKVKDFKSLSNKAIFKFMDLIEM